MDIVVKLGMNLGVVGYNFMIIVYGKVGFYDKVWQFFEKMKVEGFELDEVIYSCMIGVCG